MRTSLLLLLFASCATRLSGQSIDTATPADQTSVSASTVSQSPPANERNELRQELDVDALALSRLPADPLLDTDPLAFLLKPIDTYANDGARVIRVKLGATYTFLDQYATAVPNSVRHNQASGRLDLTGAWSVYAHENSAASISLLVRSGTNIGVSQQFNLSDQIGSALYLNCLQGGGPQEPVTVNILYWRQDLLRKRLSLYLGKIHPNEYITLSMFNNDERTQFLNGANDGNLAVASDGVYAGGGALEFQPTPHLYVHAIVVDTEGSADRGLATLIDRKYMESMEVGWASGTLGEQYRHYRVGLWRDDTKNLGSGFGGGLGFEHEFRSGWTPFGRFAFATSKGTAIRQIEGLGLARVHPFQRRGDMFGVAFTYSEPSATAKRHESIFESFYRLRLTQHTRIGPDLEVSIHPANAAHTDATTLLGARLEVLF